MNPPTLNLSLPLIRKLLWNFPEFDFQRPKSITHPADQPLYRVKLIPYTLGVELANLDQKEELFHVEFFPEQEPARAEVWHIDAWRDSLSRIIKHKPSLIYAPDDRRLSSEEAAGIFQGELVYILRSLGLSQTNATSAAELLMRGPDYSRIAIILGMKEETIRRLENMRNEIKKL